MKQLHQTEHELIRSDVIPEQDLGVKLKMTFIVRLCNVIQVQCLLLIQRMEFWRFQSGM